MGNLESRKPQSVYLIVIEKKQKEEHQKEAGMLTQIKPCKSEARYEVLKYLTPKI